ncbi:hypothetical protein DKX38_005846 [Salix brachista]|uniref:Non-specific lipid-transfer protein n=1 Tax=Salix brachista TaxID=2182728 RepID=A0A5N5N0S7_9ROSI|nr:hypothetical protein DKX38_005846 [Salix brachista]
MASSMSLRLASAMLIVMVVGSPLAEAAITCGQVTSSLAQCIGYLQKGGAVPPACCNGVKSLNSAAKTTADRQTACNCLKSLAGKISGINYGLAAGLPAKCGLNLPYQISPSTDCKTYREVKN